MPEVKFKNLGIVPFTVLWIFASVISLLLMFEWLARRNLTSLKFSSAGIGTCKFRPIFYNRPRKTGSTSLSTWMNSQYRSAGCRVFECSDSIADTEMKIIDSYIHQEKYDAIACHIIIKPGTLMRIRAMLGPRMITITSIRDPAARLVSEFRQLQKLNSTDVADEIRMKSFFRRHIGDPLWNYFYTDYWSPRGVASLFDVVLELDSSNSSRGLNVLKTHVGLDTQQIGNLNVRRSGTALKAPKKYVSEKDANLYYALKYVGSEKSNDYIRGQVDLTGR